MRAKKYKAVVFEPKGARILTDTNRRNLERTPGAIVEPELRHMKGVPLQFWKWEDGEIRPMSRPEKLERKLELKLGKGRVQGPPKYLITEREFSMIVGSVAIFALIYLLMIMVTYT